MKAKLLKEQMGVPAGTEMEVVETGRAWTLKAPSGAEIVVPSCDVEMVPDTEPFSEPKPERMAFMDPAFTENGEPVVTFAEVDPKDPGLLVNIFGGQPQPVESEGPIDPETDPAVRDEDGNVVVNEPSFDREAYNQEKRLWEERGVVFYSEAPSLDDVTDGQPERTLLDDERDVDAFPSDEESLAHPSTDDDLDEDLPESQGNCDGEGCDSCQ